MKCEKCLVETPEIKWGFNNGVKELEIKEIICIDDVDYLIDGVKIHSKVVSTYYEPVFLYKWIIKDEIIRFFGKDEIIYKEFSDYFNVSNLTTNSYIRFNKIEEVNDFIKKYNEDRTIYKMYIWSPRN